MLIKHILKEMFSFVHLRIKAGPLKGKKWIYTSGTKFINGTQEPYKVDAFTGNYIKGSVFYDIGAHFGYFSAIAAVLNDGEGRIFAFEPRPMNTRFFRKHMKLNGFENVTLFQTAVGETDGEVLFDSRHGSASGFVSPKGNTRIRQVSIDRMVKDNTLPPPDFIKIDVEGGEIEALKGMKDVIAAHRPKMIVATHNSKCHNFVISFLVNNNYRYEVLKPDHDNGDTEIIAIP